MKGILSLNELKPLELAKTLLMLLLCLSLSSQAWAGSSYELKCQNPSCNYQDSLNMGGGFIFEEISGYCEHCQKFVSVQWRRSQAGESRDLPLPPSDLATSAPTSLGTAQSPITGETAATYPCPICGGPFTEIKSIPEDGMLKCPQCGQKTLHAEHTMFYD